MSTDVTSLLVPPQLEDGISVNSSRNVKNIVDLFKFNLKVGYKRSKPRQIFGPIIGNLLIINMLRILAHDSKMWPLRNMTVLDVVTGCVFHDEPMSFYCDESALSPSVCESLFEVFSDQMKAARLTVLRYDNPISYRASLLDSEYHLGVQFLSKDQIDIGLPMDDFASLSTSPISSSECRVFNDPQCSPVKTVYSCAAAINSAALNAISSNHDIVSNLELRLFPMPSKSINGLFTFMWIIPLYLSALFLNIYNLALIELVTEKESKKIDYLVSWGITRRQHFLAWLLSNCLYGIGVILMILIGMYPVLHSGYVLPLGVASLSYFVSLLSLAYMIALHMKSAESASRVASFSDMLFNLSAIGISRIENLFFSLCFAIIPSVPFFIVLKALITESSSFVPLSMGLTTMMLLIFWGTQQTENIVKHEFPEDDEYVLKIHNFSHQYLNADVFALKNISLNIKVNEKIALIAKNGGGKSTLIKSIIGDKSCVCFQEDIFWESLSVSDHLDFFSLNLSNASRVRLDELLNLLDLTSTIRQECTSLSGGQKRRLSFLMTFLRAESDSGIRLVILDEITTGVDVQGRRLVWDLIRQLRVAVLFTTHYLDEAAALADRVCFLSEGTVAAVGNVMELSAQFGGGVICRIDGQFDISLLEAIPDLQRVDVSPGVVRLMGKNVYKAISILEKTYPKVVVESVCLDNLFDSALDEEERVNQVGNEYVGAQINKPTISMQIKSVARIRVISYFSSFGSFFSKIGIPILLVVVSTMMRAPSTSSSKTMLLPVLDGSMTIAVKGSTAFPVHSYSILHVPENITMWDFLNTDSKDISFGIEAKTIWVRPDYTIPTMSLSILRDFFSFEGEIFFTSCLSDSSISMNIVNAVYSLIMYTVFSLVMISTQSGAILFDEKKIKKLAQIQGMRVISYWVGSLIGHLIVNIPIVFSASFMAVHMLGEVVTDVPSSLIVLAIASVVCATQLILFGYLSVFIFEKKETMLKFNSLTSMILFESFVLASVTFIFASDGSFTWLYFFGSLFAPPFTIAATLADIVIQHIQYCPIGMECQWPQGWSLWANTRFVLLGGVLHVICIVMVLVLREKRGTMSFRAVNWAVHPKSEEDESVQTERQRVLNGTMDDVLFVKLWHMYEENKWVVKDLTLGVRPGEVLALLGSNGAGKTTALSILLGTIQPTAGYTGVWPGRTVGYCPQENTLWPKLNAVEHILFYSNMRGIRSKAEDILLTVGIKRDDQYKNTEKYSGGMKRRLCIAIALIGSPSVLILDEPTAGVDVGGKREIWDLLTKLQMTLTSMLITTHSLEEADHLATRIGIMNKGALVKIGSSTDWKHAEQRVRISLTLSDFDNVADTINNVFKNSISWIDDTNFELNMMSLKYSHVFREMNTFVQNMVVKDFSVRQFSLEDVFMKTIS